MSGSRSRKNPQESRTPLRIEWREAAKKISVILVVAPATIEYLKIFPVTPGAEGAKLVYDLTRRGAFRHDAIDHDGVRVPAVQHFNARSGRRTRAIYHRSGQLQDPPSGEAAWQEFDRSNGRLVKASRFQNGQQQDAVDGDPALKILDRRTGALVSAVSYRQSSYAYQRREWTPEEVRLGHATVYTPKPMAPRRLPAFLKPYRINLRPAD